MLTLHRGHGPGEPPPPGRGQGPGDRPGGAGERRARALGPRPALPGRSPRPLAPPGCQSSSDEGMAPASHRPRQGANKRPQRPTSLVSFATGRLWCLAATVYSNSRGEAGAVSIWFDCWKPKARPPANQSGQRKRMRRGACSGCFLKCIADRMQIR